MLSVRPLYSFSNADGHGVVFSDGSVRNDLEAYRLWNEHCERTAAEWRKENPAND